jgi:hypothetical protein
MPPAFFSLFLRHSLEHFFKAVMGSLSSCLSYVHEPHTWLVCWDGISQTFCPEWPQTIISMFWVCRHCRHKPPSPTKEWVLFIWFKQYILKL